MNRSGLIVLRGDATGTVARLVAGIARLPVTMPAYALVGGVAVIARLATAHRSTQDVDTVAWSEDGGADAVIRLLVEAGGTKVADGVLLEGVEVDVIGVGDFEAADLEGLDTSDRAFVVSHRWALDTAEPVRISVVDEHHIEQAGADMRLATPAALVAMKAGAIPRRRDEGRAKRASDVYDVYRLLRAHNPAGAVAGALSEAPHGLAAWCARQIRLLLGDEVERTARWLAVDGSPAMQAVAADDLRAVGALLIEDLQRTHPQSGDDTR
ncbi:MAG: nucleotidyl transferase AbiEii/AbiGii toxin family protein [Acidimicrobiia bacterium]|nr:nucleotidyl transferase AbiEii/AbiGii toxin family protein [Acidimicrobiia bacterium]